MAYVSKDYFYSNNDYYKFPYLNLKKNIRIGGKVLQSSLFVHPSSSLLPKVMYLKTSHVWRHTLHKTSLQKIRIQLIMSIVLLHPVDQEILIPSFLQNTLNKNTPTKIVYKISEKQIK